jgi:LysR family transcriptional regulator, hydrogen peroxide-inducible genes activator
MEMHQLRYVVAVAHAGNFSRAAEQCHVSQPSLSQQIQKLEEELGERLFDRMKREVKLTPHGESFLRRAVRVLEEVDTAEREAKDATDLLRGTVTLGVLPTIAPYLLPEAITEYLEKYPRVEIVVQEDTTAHLLKLLVACEIDFALASQPIRDARLEVRELFSEDLLLALPADHPLTRKRTVSASDLEGEALIVIRKIQPLTFQSGFPTNLSGSLRPVHQDGAGLCGRFLLRMPSNRDWCLKSLPWQRQLHLLRESSSCPRYKRLRTYRPAVR